MSVIKELNENKIVAVIRDAEVSTIESIVQALYDGGIKVVEITAETNHVTAIIEKVTKRYGKRVTVGAGTVLDPETARAVIMAGAEFIVSPTLNVDTIKMAKRYGVACIPGALTPTEILTAYENGADMIKIFPANVFGPGYIKSIHGPLPGIPLMVTGGIGLENMNDYITCGGVAIGIGSNLVDCKNIRNEEDLNELTGRASLYVNKLRELRKNV